MNTNMRKAHPMTNTRNDIPLLSYLDGKPVSNFRLREFENRDGLAMLDARVLSALEKVRRDLALFAGEEVWVIITDCVRTRADLEALAKRLGWADQGGAVARNSKHLAEYGGIAVDLKAAVKSTRTPIAQKTLGEICRRHFSYVKDDYADGHVHADMR